MRITKLFFALVCLVALLAPAAMIAQQETEPETPEQEQQEQEEGQEQQAPRRGCNACHTKDNFPLVSEFEDVEDHPEELPDGTKMDEETTYSECQECHATDTGTGRGVRAPIDMADIVHPSHSFSETFVDRLNGNCFSCHTVDRNGNFAVIAQRVDTKPSGIQRRGQIRTEESSYRNGGGPLSRNFLIIWIALGITVLLAVIALLVALFK